MYTMLIVIVFFLISLTYMKEFCDIKGSRRVLYNLLITVYTVLLAMYLIKLGV